MRIFPTICLIIIAAMATVAVAAETAESPLNETTLSGLQWRGIGPALMSGRIADIAVDPRSQSTWYVAVGSGGIWKTVNSGTTWAPVFDGQTSYSVGCLALDPSHPSTIWAGTGENVSGRHVGYGDGVYRSRDGGQTWEKRGLEASEHIGMIKVHPDDPGTVFVAANGPLWSAGGERGLFVTRDGGDSWEKLLGDDEYTGAGEVHFDPRDPDVMYATTWQHFRNVAALMDGGPGTGIHKSTDGGYSWRELTTGLPEEAMGKIGLAVSPQDPDVVYAAIELGNRTGGFYRSSDGGESWELRSDKVARGTGPHYYQEIFASPHAFDRVYFMDVMMSVTHDGGTTFEWVGEEHKHVDNHALVFNPHDPGYLLAGCDGGIYQSWDLGKNWKFTSNLPLTQFYKVAVDYDEPFYHIVGGTQDNNTQYGPSRTDNVHGIRNADWSVTLFGDGHQPAIDPTNPDIIYSSSQKCRFYRVDRRTGEPVRIQPQPGADEFEDRWNWDGPIVISKHDPARLYVASQRLWRSDDRGDSWTALSGDLTRAEDRLRTPMMGRVWSIDEPWDLVAMSQFGTITSIAESPLDEGLLYIGTDDGLIHVTEDGGATWREAGRPPKVSSHPYVNHLLADRFDRGTVYAVLDEHKYGDFTPLVFKSTNAGKSWKPITEGLPDRHIVWRLAQDHVNRNLLFAGTEFGVFTSLDGGESWLKLGGGFPTIPVRDLVIQERENDLVAATFGRSFWILDDYTALRDISEASLAAEAQLFTPRDTWWYIPRRLLGGSEKAAQGAAYFTSPNPPFGAVFTYYLKDGLQSQEEARKEREKALADEGADAPHPGWDALRIEETEDAPAVILTVRDQDGNVVRRVKGPVTAGINRVAWDLRGPGFAAVTGPIEEEVRSGVLMPPGTYSVELSRRIDGAVEPLAGPVSFEVRRLHEPALVGLTPEAYAAAMTELAAFQRQMSGAGQVFAEGTARVTAIKAALDHQSVDDGTLYATAVSLAKRLEAVRDQLWGHRRRDYLKETQPVSVSARLGVFRGNLTSSTYGPTPMHQEQFDLAREQFAAASAELGAVVQTELPRLEAALEAAGVPWTPGRPVPGGR